MAHTNAIKLPNIKALNNFIESNGELGQELKSYFVSAEQNDLELLLKDEYLKIIHNKNRLLIILLGPLYFSYYNLYIPSVIFTIVELYIHYVMSLNLMTGGTLSTILVILLFIVDFIFLRLIYLSFYNTLLLSLLKKKLSKIKKKDNYKELIYKYEPKSILRPIIIFLLIIIILII